MDENAAKKIAIGVLLVHKAVLERIFHRIDQFHSLLVQTTEQIPHHHADVMGGSLALQQLIVLLGLLHQGSHQILHQSTIRYREKTSYGWRTERPSPRLSSRWQ